MKHCKWLIVACLFGWHALVYVSSATITTVTTTSPDDIEGLHISVNDNGQAVAVWGRDDSGTKTIEAAYFDGSSWSAPETISDGNGGIAPWVSLNNAGKAVAIWQTGVLFGDIKVNTYLSSGSGWQGAVLIKEDVTFEASSIASKPTNRIKVGVDNTGNAVIAWLEVDDSGNPTSFFVYAARSLDTSGDSTGIASTWSTHALLNSGLTSVEGDAQKKIDIDPTSQTFKVYGKSNNAGVALISWVRANDGAYISRYQLDEGLMDVSSSLNKYTSFTESSVVGTSNSIDVNQNGDFLASTIKSTTSITQFLDRFATTGTSECNLGGNNLFFGTWVSLSNINPPTLHQAAAFQQIGNSPFSQGAGYSILIKSRVNSQNGFDCSQSQVNTVVVDHNDDCPRLNPIVCSFDDNNAVLAWNSQGTTNADSKIGLMLYDGVDSTWNTRAIQYINANLKQGADINKLDMPFYLSCSRLAIDRQHNTGLIWWDDLNNDVNVLMSRATTAPALPSPVTNLRLDSVRFFPIIKAIDLQWDGSPDDNIAKQEVYRCDGSGEFKKIDDLGPSARSYSDENVSGGPRYEYYVRVINDEDVVAGEGLFNDSVVVRGFLAVNDSFPPSALNAQCTLVGSNPAIVLSWSRDSAGVASYRIYRATTTSYKLIQEIRDGTQHTYTDQNIIDGSLYTYYISTVGFSNLESDPSNPVVGGPCFGVDDLPPAPEDLNATCLNATPEIGLTWRPIRPDTFAAQKVFRDGMLLADLTNSANAYTDSDVSLANDTEYVYEVTAVSSAGLQSNPVRTRVTCSSAAQPDPPSSAAVTCSDSSGAKPDITVTWTKSPSSNVNMYKIYRHGTAQALDEVAADMYSYDDTTADYGVAYYYSVSAVNASGVESNQQATPTITCLADVPSPIKDLSVGEECASGINGFFELFWTPPSEACTRQELYRDDKLVAPIDDCTTGRYTDYFEVVLTQEYRYQVRAYNAQDNYSESNELDVECTDTIDPESRESTCINEDDHPIFRLTWELSPTAGVTGYRIYRDNRLIADLGASETSFDDVSIAPGAIYSYNIATVTAAGERRAPTMVRRCLEGPTPEDVQGFCTLNDFGLVEEYFKTITWSIADDEQSNVASQLIYRSGVLIATLSASTRRFEDHDRPIGISETYEVKTRSVDGILNPGFATVIVTC